MAVPVAMAAAVVNRVVTVAHALRVAAHVVKVGVMGAAKAVAAIAMAEVIVVNARIRRKIVATAHVNAMINKPWTATAFPRMRQRSTLWKRVAPTHARSARIAASEVNAATGLSAANVAHAGHGHKTVKTSAKRAILKI